MNNVHLAKIWLKLGLQLNDQVQLYIKNKLKVYLYEQAKTDLTQILQFKEL